MESRVFPKYLKHLPLLKKSKLPISALLNSEEKKNMKLRNIAFKSQ